MLLSLKSDRVVSQWTERETDRQTDRDRESASTKWVNIVRIKCHGMCSQKYSWYLKLDNGNNNCFYTNAMSLNSKQVTGGLTASGNFDVIDHSESRWASKNTGYNCRK